MYHGDMNLKGSLPLLVLEVLARGPSHGYAIAQAIKARSEGVLDFKEGTLYPTLHSLERDGHLESVSEQVGGRERRAYRLTERGLGQLRAQRQAWRQLSGAIGKILEGSAS
jgi:PadR family transcriptional regulator, regulatory protein PadR